LPKSAISFRCPECQQEAAGRLLKYHGANVAGAIFHNAYFNISRATLIGFDQVNFVLIGTCALAEKHRALGPMGRGGGTFDPHFK